MEKRPFWGKAALDDQEIKKRKRLWHGRNFHPCPIVFTTLDAGFYKGDAHPAVFDGRVFGAVGNDGLAGFVPTHVGLETAMQSREGIVEPFRMAGWDGDFVE